MDKLEQLRQLREEHEALVRKANGLTQRLDALEAQLEADEKPRTVEEAPPVLVREEAPAPPPVIREPEPTPQPAAAPPRILAPQQPSAVEAWVSKKIDEFTAKAQEMGVEMFLGTWLLARVAVVLVAIAVVFLLSLALDAFGPPIRLAMGYGTAAGLLVLAWRMNARYKPFARVVFGGGFALTYLVTYATHYIGFARIFASPAPTLFLLGAVVLAWTAVGQRLKSRVVAVLVTVLGHVTVLLASTTLEHATPLSAVGILALAAGSGFFLLRNGWYYVASLGIVCSYLNYAAFLYYSPQSGRPIDFALTMATAVAYFLIFALAELFSREDLRREKIPVWFRSAFVTLNSAGFFLIGTLLVDGFDFARPHQDLFRFGAATLLLLVAFGYLHRRGRDPLYNVYITKAVVALTLGLAARYSSSTLSVWLAVESVVLLLSARRSGLVVTRVLALVAACLALGHGLYVAIDLGHVPYDVAAHTAEAVRAGLMILGFFLASQVYERTDWRPRSLTLASFHPETRLALWKFDLVGEKPDGFPLREKPLGGLLFPYLYAGAGTLLLAVYTFVLVADGHRLFATSCEVLVLTAGAAALGAAPLGVGALCLTAVAALWGMGEVPGQDMVTFRLTPFAILALGISALASERRFLGTRKGLDLHQSEQGPFFVYGLPAFVTGLAIVQYFVAFNECLALAAAAVVAAGLALVLNRRALAACSTGLLVAGGAMYLGTLNDGIAYASDRVAVTGAVLAGCALAIDRFLASRKSAELFETVLGSILIVTSWVVIVRYCEDQAADEWLVTAVGAVSFGFLAYGLLFRAKMAAGVAGLGALLASAGQIIYLYTEADRLLPTVCGAATLAVFWVVGERLYARRPDWGNEQTRLRVSCVLVALPALVLLTLLQGLPDLADINLTWATIGWFGLAVGLFAFSIPARQKVYRYAGLVIIALSIGRAFVVDMRETSALFRIAAFALLGAGLFPISYGYFRWMNRLRGEEVAGTGGHDTLAVEGDKADS